MEFKIIDTKMWSCESLEKYCIRAMKKHCNYCDMELNHGNADDILIELLNELGFKKLVKAYNKIDKWYA